MQTFLIVFEQVKLSALYLFAENVRREDGALAVTEPQLIRLRACLLVEHKEGAKDYCFGIGCVAFYGRSKGCDAILSAGCIPAIVECLRYWPGGPADGPGIVVYNACWALYRLTEFGSVTVLDSIRAVPDIRSVLETAARSRLDDYHAVATLRKLGW